MVLVIVKPPLRALDLFVFRVVMKLKTIERNIEERANLVYR